MPSIKRVIITEIAKKARLLLSLPVREETTTLESRRALDLMRRSVFPFMVGSVILDILCGL